MSYYCRCFLCHVIWSVISSDMCLSEDVRSRTSFCPRRSRSRAVLTCPFRREWSHHWFVIHFFLARPVCVPPRPGPALYIVRLRA